MRIGSKSRAIFSPILVVGLAAGLAGFRFGAAPIPGALARTKPASQSVTTPRASYADIVDRAAPAVFALRSARRVRAARQVPFFDDPFFRQFFGVRYRDRSKEVNRQPVKSAAERRTAPQRSGSRPELPVADRKGRSLFLAVQPG